MSCCFATAPTGSPTSQAWLELPLMPSTVAHVRALRQRLQAAARPTSVASSCAAGTTGCVTLLCCTTSRDLAFHGHPQSCSLSRTCRRQHGCRLLLPLESSCPRPGTVSHVTRADRPTRAQADHTRTGHHNLTRTNPLSYLLGTGCSTNPVRGRRGFIHYPSLLVAFFST